MHGAQRMVRHGDIRGVSARGAESLISANAASSSKSTFNRRRTTKATHSDAEALLTVQSDAEAAHSDWDALRAAIRGGTTDGTDRIRLISAVQDVVHNGRALLRHGPLLLWGR